MAMASQANFTEAMETLRQEIARNIEGLRGEFTSSHATADNATRLEIDRLRVEVGTTVTRMDEYSKQIDQKI